MSSIVAENAVPEQNDSRLRLYLSPAEFIDSDHAGVRAKAVAAVGSVSDPVEQARVLYRAVRDGVRYDPYIDYTDPETYRASSVLAKGHGYCVGKASLYVALCRAVGAREVDSEGSVGSISADANVPPGPSRNAAGWPLTV
jgi:transglutaminase-like putative cysteine protease